MVQQAGILTAILICEQDRRGTTISRTRNETRNVNWSFEAQNLPRTSRGWREEVNCGAYAKLGYHLDLGLGFVISDRHDPGCFGAALTDRVSYGCGRIFARIVESFADRDRIGCVVQVRYKRRLGAFGTGR